MARVLQVMSKRVFLEENRILYGAPFTAESFSADFEPASGDWHVENGWITGYISKNAGGLLYSRASFPGDIVLSFDAKTVPPCDNDINFTWKTEGWDKNSDDVGKGYIGGLGGWWVNKAGIEKYPGCVPYAATALSPVRAGETYHIEAGSVGDACFIFVDGKLAVEMLDPDYKTLDACGKFGFGTYASRVSFTNLKVYSPRSEPLHMAYPERQ
jgi:hypothetical protein